MVDIPQAVKSALTTTLEVITWPGRQIISAGGAYANGFGEVTPDNLGDSFSDATGLLAAPFHAPTRWESYRRFAEGKGKMEAVVLGAIAGVTLGATGCASDDSNKTQPDAGTGTDLSKDSCQPTCLNDRSIEICVGPEQKKQTVTCEDGWTCGESNMKAGKKTINEASCTRDALPSNDLCPPGDEVHCVLTDEIDVCEEAERSTGNESCFDSRNCGSDRAIGLLGRGGTGVTVTFFAGLPEVSAQYRVDARISAAGSHTLVVDWGNGTKRVNIDIADWPDCFYGLTGFFGAGAIIDGKVRVMFSGSSFTCEGMSLARTRLLKCWCRDTPLPPR